MIYFLYGENTYERQLALKRLSDGGAVERRDGETMTVQDLPQLLGGLTLFEDPQIVVVSDLSLQKDVWQAFGESLGAGAEPAGKLIIVETKPDKRSKTTKWLIKHADQATEFSLYQPKDSAKVLAWLQKLATDNKIDLEPAAAREMLSRLGPDQSRLHQELLRLGVLGKVSFETILEHTPRTPSDNAFDLFKVALEGNYSELKRQLDDLRVTADPYMTLGLLASQGYQYALLAYSTSQPDILAKEVGVHPFALKKLVPLAAKRGKLRAPVVIEALLEADTALKSSPADKWLLIERALLKIAATS